MGSCYSGSAFQRKSLNGECSGQEKHEKCHRMLEALVNMRTYNRNMAAEKYMAIFEHTLLYKDVLQSGSVFDKLILKSLNLQIHERNTGSITKLQLEWGSDEDYLLPVNSEHPMSSPKPLEDGTTPVYTYGTESVIPSEHTSLELVLVQTTSCHTGYCRLGLRETDPVTGLPKTNSVHLLKNDCLLRNKIVQQYCNISPNDLKAAIRLKLELRPRFLTAFQTDLVLCFEYRGWPEGTEGISKRPSKSGWPSVGLRSKLRHLNILIVRKPHPSSQKPEYEFRLSFSLPEAVLCWSIPDEVRHPFCTCKLLVGITNYDKRMSCYVSYHLKTILLWSMEQKTTQEFRDMSLKGGVLFFLAKLTEAYKKEELPHYFIPGNNLLDHVPKPLLEKTICVLHDVKNNICGLSLYFHLHCSPLSNCAAIATRFQSYKAYIAAKNYLGKLIVAQRLGQQQKVQKHASDARHQLQQALTLEPCWTALSVDFGYTLWRTGNEVGAMVLWLNAAVISTGLRLNADDESGRDIVNYYRRWHCSFDQAVQFQIRFVQESDQYGFSMHFLPTFHLVKYGLLPVKGADHLTNELEKTLVRAKKGKLLFPGSMKIGYYILACCFGIVGELGVAARHLLDSLDVQTNPKRIDVTNKLLFVPHDFEAIRSRLALYRELQNETLRSRPDVTMYDIIAPIAEYVRCHRDSIWRNRRHSFSGSSNITAAAPQSPDISYRQRRHSLSDLHQLGKSPCPSHYRDVIRQMYTAHHASEIPERYRFDDWGKGCHSDNSGDAPVVTGSVDFRKPYADAKKQAEEVKRLAQEMRRRGLRPCSVMQEVSQEDVITGRLVYHDTCSAVGS